LRNFVLKQLLKYTELLQCNGEVELRKFQSREGWLAICGVWVSKYVGRGHSEGLSE